MKIEWVSGKGQQRKLNGDAAALAYRGDFLVAAIVDVAEKTVNEQLVNCTNPEGKRLAAYWVENCVKEILNTPRALVDESELVELLARLQKELRRYYLHDVASYGILLLNTKSFVGKWYFVGDCLLGKANREGQLAWLHRSHRVSDCAALANIPNSEILLFKSLNARRFVSPETLDLPQLLRGEMLVLATDGYWCEHLKQGVKIESLEDDCSLLKIEIGEKELSSKTDAANLYLY